MAEYTLEEAPTNLDPLENDSVYEAEIIDLEERQRETKDGRKYDQLNWRFVIVDDEVFEGKNIYADIPPAFNRHPDNKFHAWVLAIEGVEELPVGYVVNTDKYKGSQVRVRIGRRDYQKDGEDKVYNFVKDVMPSSSTRPTVPPVVQDTYGEEPF